MSTLHAIVVWGLVGLAAFLAFAGALGVMVMRDPYQRVHFMSPAATSATALLLVALIVDEPHPSVWLKTLLLLVLLTLMNAVLSHANARAVFVRNQGKWPPDPQAIPLVDEEES